MQLLVFGGTAFLGREVAVQAVARGWSVTCAARGRSGPFPDGVRAVVVDRNDEDALAPLADRTWDAVIDLARQPGQVGRAVRGLAAGHRVFVSTANVYADQATQGQDETAALLEPLAGEAMSEPGQYGAAKVACEAQLQGSASWTIARAGLIAGPGDVSGRLGYWPWRFARDQAGPVVVPDDADQPVQVIDVRDLAGWLLDCAAERIGGVFNACGDPLRLGAVLAESRAVAGHVGRVRAVDAAWLAGHGVNAWMGERSLPLWLGGDRGLWGFQDHRNDRAVASGLTLRPLTDTLRDTLAWERTGRVEPRAAGLGDSEHDRLLRALDEVTGDAASGAGDDR